MLSDILLNLSILSKVKKGGRICKDRNGKIYIDSSWSLQGIFRTLKRYDRYQTINDIQHVINEAFEKVKDTVESMSFKIYKVKESPTDSEVREHMKKVADLDALCKALVNCIKGIENLKYTYSELDDESIVSGLDLIINSIATKEIEINSELDIYHYECIQVRRASTGSKSRGILKKPGIRIRENKNEVIHVNKINQEFHPDPYSGESEEGSDHENEDPNFPDRDESEWK